MVLAILLFLLAKGMTCNASDETVVNDYFEKIAKRDCNSLQPDVFPDLSGIPLLLATVHSSPGGWNIDRIDRWSKAGRPILDSRNVIDGCLRTCNFSENCGVKANQTAIEVLAIPTMGLLVAFRSIIFHKASRQFKPTEASIQQACQLLGEEGEAVLLPNYAEKANCGRCRLSGVKRCLDFTRTLLETTTSICKMLHNVAISARKMDYANLLQAHLSMRKEACRKPTNS